jgi:hypothetical protein
MLIMPLHVYQYLVLNWFDSNASMYGLWISLLASAGLRQVKNPFLRGGIHRVGFLTQNDRVSMKMMVGRRDLQFNVGPEPLCWPSIIHFPKFYLWQRVSS